MRPDTPSYIQVLPLQSPPETFDAAAMLSGIIPGGTALSAKSVYTEAPQQPNEYLCQSSTAKSVTNGSMYSPDMDWSFVGLSPISEWSFEALSVDLELPFELSRSPLNTTKRASIPKHALSLRPVTLDGTDPETITTLL